MKLFYQLSSLLILQICCFVFVAGQKKAEMKSAVPVPTPSEAAQIPPKPKTVPEDMISFFVGEWGGAGEFSSGKKIEADVSFSAELDNQRLLYRHTDRIPNRYKALGTWGFESETGKFVMVIEDNFGGSRRFVSDGWKDGKIIFLKDVPITPKSFPERFTFEKLAENSFKMTYESNRNGQAWKLGDYIIFKKK